MKRFILVGVITFTSSLACVVGVFLYIQTIAGV
jgi:hypothetical protein